MIFAVAVNVTCPVVATALASPEELTVAMFGSLVVHVTRLVIRWVVLPKLPSAVNCRSAPGVKTGFVGPTVIDVSVPLETVTVVDPEAPPLLAVMVALPSPVVGPFAVTNPLVSGLTLATPSFELDHVAVPVTSVAVPPTVSAEAVNCWVSPIFMKTLVGVRVTLSTELFEGKKSSHALNARIMTIVGINSRSRFMRPHLLTKISTAGAPWLS